MTDHQLEVAAIAAATERWGTRAKPPEALGRLEALGTHVAGVTGVCPPVPIVHPAVAVFAGDHGVVRSGASAWPSEVTGLMVSTMADGAAAINCIAAVAGAEVRLVDVGVASDLSLLEGVEHAKVREGTGDISREPAMLLDEARDALAVGRATAAELIDGGADLLAAGDMGIGNTTPSAAIIASTTQRPVAELVGPGAGLASDRLNHKTSLVQAALGRSAGLAGLDLFASIGGLEILAMAGLYLEAAERRVPFVVDGVIACAALCVAEALESGVASLAIAGHVSAEPAAAAALAHLGLDPLIDLGLRLGEGTGACLAFPLVSAAVECLRGMADLPV